MPDYTTGSYIMKTRKSWSCRCCGKPITEGKQFVRVTEFGEERVNAQGQKYRHKDYDRYHISCAINMSNLNDFERDLLRPHLHLGVQDLADVVNFLERSGVIIVDDPDELIPKLLEYKELSR